MSTTNIILVLVIVVLGWLIFKNGKQQKQAAAGNRIEAAEFLAQNAQKSGVTTTDSGLQYEVLNKDAHDPLFLAINESHDRIVEVLIRKYIYYFLKEHQYCKHTTTSSSASDAKLYQFSQYLHSGFFMILCSSVATIRLLYTQILPLEGWTALGCDAG